MHGLTSGELARLRSDMEDTLPDTMNVLIVTNTSDNAGGFTETWGTLTTGVACRLDPIRPRGEQLAAGVIADYTSWMLTYPYDTTLTTAYRVEISGVSYNVISVNGGSWLAEGRAVVEKI